MFLNLCHIDHFCTHLFYGSIKYIYKKWTPLFLKRHVAVIMHGQYYDYWCHGAEKSKVINRYGIDLITQNIEASVPEGIEALCGLLDQQYFIALFGL